MNDAAWAPGTKTCGTDINPLSAQLAKERLGYPTQKPLALLERIIRASSNPGDVVLDPFCGCGTAIDAAQSLGRRWLGIDVTHLSVALMKYRLQDRHGLRAGHSPRQVEGHDYRVIGEPQDLAGARNLAQQEHDGRYQFQWWALSLIGARPLGASGQWAQGNSPRREEGKKGADGGVDGLIHFLDEDKRTQRVVVQVKSGKVSRPDIGDLRGLLQGAVPPSESSSPSSHRRARCSRRPSARATMSQSSGAASRACKS